MDHRSVVFWYKANGAPVDGIPVIDLDFARSVRHDPAARGIFSVALVCLLMGAVDGAAAAQATAPIDAARTYRQTHAVEILGSFAELLSIPNTPAEPDGLRRTAETIRGRLAARGVAANLLEIEGAPPAVFGRLETPGATRTLGLYVHYDGQPVDPERWSHPPFEPVFYDGSMEQGARPIPAPRPGRPIDPEWRIYARSAGDDKAPVPAILAALDALEASGIPRTSNLVFFFEGEEERGSPHLRQFFETYGEQLDADLWLICDGPVHQSRRPQLVFGVRGITDLEITVYGAERYLHSGHYGNWAPNPAMMLARLLASMKDDTGHVTIAGFYDTVAPLSEAGREAVERVPPIDEALRAELGLARTEAGNALLVERLMLPSLNVRGLESATVGETARNVIPTTATASLDIRLVPGNDPLAMQGLVEKHIAARGYHIVREEPDHPTRLAHPLIARVVRGHGYRSFRTPLDLPVVQPVIRAAEDASDGEVILLPLLGGSLPLYLFDELLDTPLVIVPIANHDDNQHAPDENLRLANLWYGIELFAALFAMP
jgi:acetylornithine deacetylase/succinyl-diaminopimelate desuccinylase-like protein